MKNKVTMQKIMQGKVEHDTKVTFLGKGKWGVRILLNGEVNQEIVVDRKSLIQPAIKSMLRMEDKCGNISGMADRSRMRK